MLNPTPLRKRPYCKRPKCLMRWVSRRLRCMFCMQRGMPEAASASMSSGPTRSTDCNHETSQQR